jgi:hypothetical protein
LSVGEKNAPFFDKKTAEAGTIRAFSIYICDVLEMAIPTELDC